MSEPTILTARNGAVMTITLNRPKALNALVAKMYVELADALMAAAKPDVRAVIITGAGKGFCAGQDLNDSGSDDPAADLRFVDGTVKALRGFEKPVIAAVNGAAAGGGMAYALAADIRIASSSAFFAPAFLDLGLVPDLGTSWFVVEAMGYARAFEWLSSGRRMPAAEAQVAGLVHEVVAPEALLPRAMERASALAEKPTRALGLTKQLLQRASRAQFEAQLENEAQAQTRAGETEDYSEALSAFRERRPPKFTGR